MRRNRKDRQYDISDDDATARSSAEEGGFDVAVPRARPSVVDTDDEEAEGEWIAVTGAVLSSAPRTVQSANQINAPSPMHGKQSQPIATSGTQSQPIATSVAQHREGTSLDTDAPVRETRTVNAASPSRWSPTVGAVSPSTTNFAARHPVSPRSAWSDGSDDDDDRSLRRLSGRLTEAQTALMTAIGRAFDLLNAYAESPEVRVCPGAPCICVSCSLLHTPSILVEPLLLC